MFYDLHVSAGDWLTEWIEYRFGLDLINIIKKHVEINKFVPYRRLDAQEKSLLWRPIKVQVTFQKLGFWLWNYHFVYHCGTLPTTLCVADRSNHNRIGFESTGYTTVSFVASISRWRLGCSAGVFSLVFGWMIWQVEMLAGREKGKGRSTKWYHYRRVSARWEMVQFKGDCWITSDKYWLSLRIKWSWNN